MDAIKFPNFNLELTPKILSQERIRIDIRDIQYYNRITLNGKPVYFTKQDMKIRRMNVVNMLTTG